MNTNLRSTTLKINREERANCYHFDSLIPHQAKLAISRRSRRFQLVPYRSAVSPWLIGRIDRRGSSRKRYQVKGIHGIRLRRSVNHEKHFIQVGWLPWFSELLKRTAHRIRKWFIVAHDIESISFLSIKHLPNLFSTREKYLVFIWRCSKIIEWEVNY